ncbi:hypothetical protein Pst134EA_007540 [Puccinia striiformis f. sp. tritici]|uniref:hypothetical protein n=1 Tax=Puccinia striiformis f. sp. tritici TaxID=168172 RepID=UPI0020079FF5|nr:hypothetical protein Pst134EA_007540 [Puccinia striiformis f. sp. tritici]KAH9460484.1 hypothetical protein Pst134EB_008655 [Puccinia striiformis f. sp. tritici]KAH9470276.1 hypothetical protein Pst134EA_007540 [Puccinia striiformis f. sp. tritici]
MTSLRSNSPVRLIFSSYFSFLSRTIICKLAYSSLSFDTQPISLVFHKITQHKIFSISKNRNLSSNRIPHRWFKLFDSHHDFSDTFSQSFDPNEIGEKWEVKIHKRLVILNHHGRPMETSCWLSAINL